MKNLLALVVFFIATFKLEASLAPNPSNSDLQELDIFTESLKEKGEIIFSGSPTPPIHPAQLNTGDLEKQIALLLSEKKEINVEELVGNILKEQPALYESRLMSKEDLEKFLIETIKESVSFYYTIENK